MLAAMALLFFSCDTDKVVDESVKTQAPGTYKGVIADVGNDLSAVFEIIISGQRSISSARAAGDIYDATLTVYSGGDVLTDSASATESTGGNISAAFSVTLDGHELNINIDSSISGVPTTTGTVDGSEISSISAQKEGETTIELWEGSYTGSGTGWTVSGIWNFSVNDSAVICSYSGNITDTFYSSTTPDGDILDGAVSGSSISLSNETITATGSFNGESASGSWSRSGDGVGSWSGSKTQ